jgi:hypothetical protein
MLIVVFIANKYLESRKDLEEDKPILDTIKIKIKELRSIDKILNNLITDEDNLSSDNLLINYISNDIEDRYIKLGKYKWRVSKKELEDMIKGNCILYITERTIYLPVVHINKMVKGIVEERGIKVEIKKEEINEESNEEIEDIKINVVSSDEEEYNILLDECTGKLLFLYLDSV